MFSELFKFARSSILGVFVLILALSFWGCASRSSSGKGSRPDKNIQLKHINGISVSDENGSETVNIKGDGLLTYTSIKQPFPLSVILYFPETDIDVTETENEPDSELINSIKVSQLAEKDHTSRVEILLKKDVLYEVRRDESGLNVIFNDFEETAESEVLAETETTVPEEEVKMAQTDLVDMEPKTEPAEADPEFAMEADELPPLRDASILESVFASKFSDNIKINLKANGLIKDYKVFTLKNPARIVFDVFNIKTSYRKEQVIQVGEEFVEKVRYCTHPDSLRIVIDTKDNYLKQFEAVTTANGLAIQVGNVQTGPTGSLVAAGAVATPAMDVETAPEGEISEVRAKPSWINRIEFSSEEKGKSSVLIGTTHPIDFEVTKADEKQVQLTLVNAKLPKYRQRPLITTRFESAVDRIIPVASPSVSGNSIVIFELREAVPYFVEQEGNLLHVRFEASTVAPKPIEETNLPSWKTVLNETVAEMETAGVAPPPVEPGAEVMTESLDMAGDVPVEQAGEEGPDAEVEKKKEFTGKKIALDFYKTDIQNVFRILRDVSGKNFAIDKDVSGTVTITLDKPVPWDQVLDLILKMNQLGQVYEGDIVRIATLATLKEEESLRQEAMEAKQKSNEQEKALESLVTEYIPINYSNAEKDIKSHLEMILTKERGSISVDARTNQIIMVDVPEKIELARNIVKKLDKVTPQVIIEARIVEANTSFARELGTEWGMKSEDVYNSDLKGDYNANIAMNNPIESTLSNIGFSFEKIGGTPFVLDAKLSAMESQGEGKIVSSPKIVTLDNNKATIKQGIEYPYAVIDDGDVSIEFKAIDLLLEVTPHVTSDNRIAINIKITKNDIFQETSPPALTTKEVETELLINDGDTIVIGGIIKTTKRDLDEGWPILSKLPGVGWLFKVSKRNDDKEELLIFLTPTIVQLEQPHI